MDKFDRIQQLHRIFSSRRYPVPISVLAKELDCTEKTVMRAIDLLRDNLSAPLEYHSDYKGWAYDKNSKAFELPGFWLTANDLQSLSTLLQLLSSIGPGLLTDEFRGIEKQLDKLLQSRGLSRDSFAQHIRILPQANRSITNLTFQKIADAIFREKRLDIRYCDYTGRHSNRQISPVTLVYYAENWYLDAWCHLRNDLRTFSISRIKSCETTNETAEKVDQKRIEQHFTAGYGIFSGAAKHTAQLRFSPSIAREIASQNWHPQQQGEWRGDEYLLQIPYSDDRELIQEILRHTPNVYVQAPAALRKKVQSRLQRGLELNLGRGLGWL